MDITDKIEAEDFKVGDVVSIFVDGRLVIKFNYFNYASHNTGCIAGSPCNNGQGVVHHFSSLGGEASISHTSPVGGVDTASGMKTTLSHVGGSRTTNNFRGQTTTTVANVGAVQFRVTGDCKAPTTTTFAIGQATNNGTIQVTVETGCTVPQVQPSFHQAEQIFSERPIQLSVKNATSGTTCFIEGDAANVVDASITGVCKFESAQLKHQVAKLTVNDTVVDSVNLVYAEPRARIFQFDQSMTHAEANGALAGAYDGRVCNAQQGMAVRPADAGLTCAPETQRPHFTSTTTTLLGGSLVGFHSICCGDCCARVHVASAPIPGDTPALHHQSLTGGFARQGAGGTLVVRLSGGTPRPVVAQCRMPNQEAWKVCSAVAGREGELMTMQLQDLPFDDTVLVRAATAITVDGLGGLVVSDAHRLHTLKASATLDATLGGASTWLAGQSTVHFVAAYNGTNPCQGGVTSGGAHNVTYCRWQGGNATAISDTLGSTLGGALHRSVVSSEYFDWGGSVEMDLNGNSHNDWGDVLAVFYSAMVLALSRLSHVDTSAITLEVTNLAASDGIHLVNFTAKVSSVAGIEVLQNWSRESQSRVLDEFSTSFATEGYSIVRGMMNEPSTTTREPLGSVKLEVEVCDHNPRGESFKLKSDTSLHLKCSNGDVFSNAMGDELVLENMQVTPHSDSHGNFTTRTITGLRSASSPSVQASEVFADTAEVSVGTSGMLLYSDFQQMDDTVKKVRVRTTLGGIEVVLVRGAGYLKNKACTATSVTLQSLDDAGPSGTREASFGDNSKVRAISMACSDVACGCDDPSANSVELTVDTDTQSCGATHCNCAVGQCNAGTGTDTRGAQCGWSPISNFEPTTRTNAANEDIKKCVLPTATFSTTAIISSTVATPRPTCGDGKMSATHNTNQCPNVESGYADVPAVLEECDIWSESPFGSFKEGCDPVSCKETSVTNPNGFAPDTDVTNKIKRRKQLLFGAASLGDLNYNYNGSTDSVKPAVGVSLYSSIMVDTLGDETMDMKQAVGFRLTKEDYIKYTTLNYCVNTGDLDHETNTTILLQDLGNLTQVGHSFTDDVPKFQINKHKCEGPVSVSVKGPVIGSMSWEEEKFEQTTNSQVMIPTRNVSGVPVFPNTHDVCIDFFDGNWPAVHSTSKEIVAQSSFLSYEIVCDPADQILAFDESDCTAGDCGRFGGRENPCDVNTLTWDLMACDDDDCKSLQSHRHVYESRFGNVTWGNKVIGKGTKYTFEHDADPKKNVFQCAVKNWNNTKLFEYNHTEGDATAAQYKYVCRTGGQDTPCVDNLGEIVHSLNTCSNGGEPNRPIRQFADSSQLSNFVPNSTEYAEIQSVEEELLTYPVTCGRRLKFKASYGSHGSLQLRVNVYKYSSQIDPHDPARGHFLQSSHLIPVHITATVRPQLLGSFDAFINQENQNTTEGGEIRAAFDLSAMFGGDSLKTQDIHMRQMLPSGKAQFDKYFSLSTRARIEFTDCTDGSSSVVSVESNQLVPRFRLSAGLGVGNPDFIYTGKYWDDNNVLQSSSAKRTYTLQKEFNMVELKAIDTDFFVRSFNEVDTASWWPQSNQRVTGDNWNDQYAAAGICLQAKLVFYEPSSCSRESVVSNEFQITIEPKPPTDLAITFDQTDQVYDEDQMVELLLNISHPTLGEDSLYTYYSHIDIEEIYTGSDSSNYGGETNFFSYGQTIGPTNATSTTDAITTDSNGNDVEPGVRLLHSDDGTRVHRSYTNKVTRWLKERQEAGLSGGFNSDALRQEISSLGFATVEDALLDARQVGQKLWGGTGQGAGRRGLWLRPQRKSTKQIKFKVTLYAYDGDPTDSSGATADATMEVVHTPIETRFDQDEIILASATLKENTKAPLDFPKLELPKPLQANVKLCTYTSKKPMDIDAYVDLEKRDIVCVDISDCSGTFNSNDYRVTCEDGGDDDKVSRTKLDTIIIRDKTPEATAVGGKLPYDISYQPAGDTSYASGGAWYKLQSCDAANEANIDPQWCHNSTTPVECEVPSGDYENFWVIRTNETNRQMLAEDSVCIQGLSDFNTQRNIQTSIKLEIVAWATETLTTSLKNLTTPSVSTSTSASGQVIVESVVQPVEASTDRSSGAMTWKLSDTGADVYIEERNDYTRAATGEPRTWGNMVGSTTLTGSDCDEDDTSDTFCFDVFDFEERNTFGDQYLGQMDIQVEVRKACGVDTHTEWVPAGGLVDVYVDNVTLVSESWLARLDDGVLRDCLTTDTACHEVQQTYFDAYNGVNPTSNAGHGSHWPGVWPAGVSFMAGGAVNISRNWPGAVPQKSQCDQYLHNDDTLGVKSFDCVLAPAKDLVGDRWDHYGHVYTNEPSDGFNRSRAFKTHLKVKFPEKWSNCIQFKLTVKVSNEDRSGMKLDNSDPTWSDPVSVVVEPLPIAERPVFWIQERVTASASCIGNRSPGCNGEEGTEARFGSNYTAISSNGFTPMIERYISAGHMHQIRAFAASVTNDDDYSSLEDLFSIPGPINATEELNTAGYAYDHLRSALNASGEHVYITVESRRNALYASGGDEHFCLWFCPPGRASCGKHELIRVKPLPEDPTHEAFNRSNVNGEKCTPGEVDGGKCDATGYPKDDPFGLDPSLMGCPKYDSGDPHRPGSRYSFRCPTAGNCPQMKNMFIQYPSEQTVDDVLEFSACSRQDYREGGAGYMCASLNMAMRIAPSITLSTVGFSAQPEIASSVDNNDWSCDAANRTQDCPTGMFGAPVQPAMQSTYRSGQQYPIQIVMYEEELQGDIGECKEAAMNFSPTRTQATSDSNITKHCGMRVFSRFPDPLLSAVSAVGVDVRLVELTDAIPLCSDGGVNHECVENTGRGIVDGAQIVKMSSLQLQTSLQMVVNSYTVTGTNRTAAGNFITVTNQDSTSLQPISFDDWELLSGSGSVSAATYATYAPDYTASRNEWRSGDRMHHKEVDLVASDVNSIELSDYTFGNNICEKPRQFGLRLDPPVGYSTEVIRTGYDNIVVTVLDSSYFGSFAMARMGDHGIIEAFDATGGSTKVMGAGKLAEQDSDGIYQHGTFEAWDSNNADKRYFYVVRRRLLSETLNSTRGAVPMQPAVVRFDVNTTDITGRKWALEYKEVYANGEPIDNNNAVSIKGTAGTFDVPFEGCTPDPTVECGAAYNTTTNQSAAQCTCASTIPANKVDVDFQWMKITLVKEDAASIASCETDDAPILEFKIKNVRYPDDPSKYGYKSGEVIGADCPRNPNPSSNIMTKFGFAPSNSSVNIADEYYRFNWAGVNQTQEADKAQPLNWDGSSSGRSGRGEGPIFGNTFMTFAETEHTQCAGTPAVCAQREIKMHMCLRPRTDEANSTVTPSDMSGKKFFVTLRDATEDYATIGDDYALECPTHSYEVDDSGNKDVKIECTPYSKESTQCDDADLNCARMPIPCDLTKFTRLVNACSNGIGDGDIDLGDPATFQNCTLTATSDEETAELFQQYCADTIPKRLLFNVNVDGGATDNIPTCPSSAAGFPTGNAVELPYITFRALDDAGLRNLARRPSICMENDISEVISEADAIIGTRTTCSKFGRARPTEKESAVCFKMRIEDDEVTTVDHSHENRDVDVFDPHFGDPKWDSDAGRVSVTVNDRYFLEGSEKTLVNIGVGTCDDKPVWENATDNPFSNNRSPFGTCDFLDASNFGNVGDLDISTLFKLLFNESSFQPSGDDYANATSTSDLFGMGAPQGLTNMLFSSPREINENALWSAIPVEMSNLGNMDLSKSGFAATFSASIEEIKNCVLSGSRGDAMRTSIEPITGNTQYAFNMSVTHITAAREGDTSHTVFSSKCVDRQYTMSVGSSIMALSGIQAAGGTAETNNAVYVKEMGYAGSGFCSIGNYNDTCRDDLGPENPCGDPSDGQLRAMRYSVNLDMRVLSRQTAQGQKTSYFVVNSKDEVFVDSNNCYGAIATGVEVSKGTKRSASGTLVPDASVARSSIVFNTECLNVRTNDTVSRPDTFVSCANASRSNTDFGFRVYLWECTDLAEAMGGGDLSQAGSCHRLSDYFTASIAMAFVEDTHDLTFSLPFEKEMKFYRDVDHRSGSGFRQGDALNDWRASSELVQNNTDQPIKIPVDSSLAVSLGFRSGSPLEASITTTIRDVRLCQFKQPCYLEGYSPQTHGVDTTLEACTDVMLTAGTHSPLVTYARNTQIEPGKGCAEEGGCKVSALQTDPLPYLTCDKARWEDWAIAEAGCYAATQPENCNPVDLQSVLVTSLNTLSARAKALLPVKEAQLLVADGGTTPFAANVHGNCETNPEDLSVADKFNVSNSQGVNQEMDLYVLLPKADEETSVIGCCTCKGMLAYNYEDSGEYPFRETADRRVLYSEEPYTGNKAHASRLHLCPWRNSPSHSLTGGPLRSVDQFIMSLKNIPRNDPDAPQALWSVEVIAMMYDDRMMQQLEDLGMDQFHVNVGSRRLLSAEETSERKRIRAHVDIFRRAAHKHATSSRKALQVLLPMEDEVPEFNQARMPQSASLQQATTQPGTSSLTQLGFLIDYSEALEEQYKDLVDYKQGFISRNYKIGEVLQKLVYQHEISEGLDFLIANGPFAQFNRTGFFISFFLCWIPLLVAFVVSIWSFFFHDKHKGNYGVWDTFNHFRHHLDSHDEERRFLTDFHNPLQNTETVTLVQPPRDKNNSPVESTEGLTEFTCAQKAFVGVELIVQLFTGQTLLWSLCMCVFQLVRFVYEVVKDKPYEAVYTKKGNCFKVPISMLAMFLRAGFLAMAWMFFWYSLFASVLRVCWLFMQGCNPEVSQEKFQTQEARDKDGKKPSPKQTKTAMAMHIICELSFSEVVYHQIGSWHCFHGRKGHGMASSAYPTKAGYNLKAAANRAHEGVGQFAV